MISATDVSTSSCSRSARHVAPIRLPASFATLLLLLWCLLASGPRGCGFLLSWGDDVARRSRGRASGRPWSGGGRGATGRLTGIPATETNSVKIPDWAKQKGMRLWLKRSRFTGQVLFLYLWSQLQGFINRKVHPDSSTHRRYVCDCGVYSQLGWSSCRRTLSAFSYLLLLLSLLLASVVGTLPHGQPPLRVRRCFGVVVFG